MSTTAWEYSVEVAFERVKLLLAEVGITEAIVQQRFGRKHMKELGKPPRLVWVPDRERPDDDAWTNRGDDEHDSLGGTREHFLIACWGRTHIQATALRHNVKVALKRIYAVDVRFESGEWAKQVEGWNALGELVMLDVSLGTPVPNAFVTIPQAPETDHELPDPDTVIPTRIEAVIETAETLESLDSEIVLETSTG